MVALTLDTDHERFEAIAEQIESQSLSSDIHKIEGQFAKVIVAKLSVDEAYKVSLIIYVYVCIMHREEGYGLSCRVVSIPRILGETIV